jgi:hypothetical protein
MMIPQTSAAASPPVIGLAGFCRTPAPVKWIVPGMRAAVEPDSALANAWFASDFTNKV